MLMGVQAKKKIARGGAGEANNNILVIMIISLSLSLYIYIYVIKYDSLFENNNLMMILI